MTMDASLLTGLGAVLSIFLASIGSAIASAEAGIFALRSHSGFFKSFIPIVIAGVLAIYGIIVGVLLSGKLHHQGDDLAISTVDGYRYLCAGLSVGLACAASGYGLAIFIRHTNGEHHRPKPSSVAPESEPLLGSASAANNDRFGAGAAFRSVHDTFDARYFCVLVFLEAIALYGLIVALFLIGK